MKKGYTIILLFFVSFVRAEKLVVLSDVMKPHAMAAGINRIFIAEGTTVFAFSMDDFQLVKKIGKEGEGPGEFKRGHAGPGVNITVSADNLLVNSETKMSWFNRDGKFLKESRIPPLQVYLPVGKNFVANTTYSAGARNPCLCIRLYDSELKKINDLFLSDLEVSMSASIPAPPYNYSYRYADGLIFVSTGKKDILIDVFATAGEKVRRIAVEVPLLPVKKSYKNRVLDFYRTDPQYKNFWNLFKNNLKFQDNYPGLRDFAVEGGRIYAMTHKTDGRMCEWLVLNLEGDKIGDLLLPLGHETPASAPLFAISGGFYYYLINRPDEDDELWELHREKIRY